ncbi:altronate oxidoreductase [Heyndrickxia shackletonii]|uniref:Altronate oxidoreductase n=1 Tax=Heyndrickxia shackletonii TaxID=157838 RepID=A0A0Q3TFE2_9BACI|nr:tagaturonate reductase [Heyndrickxia shackletonii]KQL52816.1 altronate oxidoreductase [Heyndrickxia shackletonii]NEZ00046.1 tagaturonate reductase [Heyndrickxia shackletonii]
MNNIHSSSNLLNEQTETIKRNYRGQDYPVKVLQIGEGNFLRGFFDWMIHECNKQGNFQGSIVVTQPRPSGKGMIEKLANQDCLYTLMIRGLQNGAKIEHKEIIPVFAGALNPYEEWKEFLALACSPTLEFIVSNTTEAGLSYQTLPWKDGEPIESFPGKLTAFLYRRYVHFNGDPKKGLIMLPCELLEKNGDILKRYVLQHSKDWGLPLTFMEWVERDNLFLNSLVDRIVTGFPEKEAECLFSKWGYRDLLLNTAEPYHFWAIEGNPELEKKLPLRKSGLNVQWVKDLAPYQIRKVRILNGSHTLMALLGILSGMDTVGEWVSQSESNQFLRETVDNEIIPTLAFDRKEIMEYAESVFERFMNPFVQHRLADISLNSISKFKVRLLPTIESYYEKNQKLPDNLIRAFAALIRFYQIEKMEDGYIGFQFNGDSYVVKDHEQVLSFMCERWSQFKKNELSLQNLIKQFLGNDLFWDKDLNQIDGLSSSIYEELKEMI